MKYLLAFTISFLIVFLFYLVTVILQKKRYDQFKQSNQVLYFVKKYKIDIDKIDISKFVNLISLVNSFIIASAFTVTFLVENIFLQLLVGLVVLIPLLLLIYHIIGMKLKNKKEGK